MMNYPVTKLGENAREKRDKRILELREMGLKQWQIALRMGMSKGGVGSILRRSRNGKS